MKFLPKNTLAYFNDAPQVHQHDFSELPTGVFAESTGIYKKDCDQTSPNNDAVTFYALNHCASVVRKMFTQNEVLPAWALKIMTMYTDVCMSQGERILHYILCITTRETRHLKSCTPKFWADVASKFDQKSVNILKHISSDGDENTAMNKYIKTPPDMTIGQFVNTLSYAFHHAGSHGWNGSYGGHPWGQVTDAVISYLHGVTSMEMLVDTGYTLAHNGGPIFNKGMMYGHQDTNKLFTVLDVQRSGQMLDLIVATETLGVNKTVEALEAVALIKEHCPTEFQGYVDWKLVDDLRPAKDKAANPHKYQKQTTAQKQPTKVAKAKAAKAAAAASVTAPSTMTTLLGKKIKVTGTFQVYPHQNVNIVERVGS
jgi:hypothetical protein